MWGTDAAIWGDCRGGAGAVGKMSQNVFEKPKGCQSRAGAHGRGQSRIGAPPHTGGDDLELDLEWGEPPLSRLTDQEFQRNPAP